MKQRMSQFGFILKDSGLDDKTFSELEKYGLELEDIYNDAVSKAKGIDGSDTFTSKGKMEQKRELAAEINEKLKKFDRISNDEYEHTHGQSFTKEIRKLQESMKKPFDLGVDPTLQFLRQQEVRNLLRQIGDPLKTEPEIRKRCERGDFCYLDAILAAPEGTQTFISDKQKEVLLNKKLEAANPLAAKRIQLLQTAQSRLKGMINGIKGSLKKQDLYLDDEKPIEFLSTG